ncbi:MAG: T9SS type A sorting domain-containing protein [Bacteroidota bacterium]
MKNLTLLVLLAFVFKVSAQDSHTVGPKSWNISSMDKVTPIKLSKPDLTRFKAEDAVNDLDKSKPWRFGYDHFVNYGLDNAGKWHNLPNGDRIWRIHIISPDALTMNVLFDRYKIPVGGKVFVYNNDRSEVLNPYTHSHNNPEEILGTWMVTGESIWIEYFEPKDVIGQGRLNIGNVIHGYRTIIFNEASAQPLNTSGDCNVDVNCDINGFSSTAHNIKEQQKSAVGMILVNGGTGFCTGALVNNTSNDGTPYFLTANHCLGGSVNGWAYRFNWASNASVADCATPAPSVDNTFIQTTSGGTLRAANSESDMALIEITDTSFFTNNAANLVWSGWNRSVIDVPSLTVGVHHPGGDIQKLCVDLNTPTRQSIDFNGNQNTKIWRIADWDVGVTEPGSSGSPLFDQNGLIIGKLTGGLAACSGTNDNNLEDWYGRFGVSWDFGVTNASQLKFWLDPVGSNPVGVQNLSDALATNIDAAVSLRDVPDILCGTVITPSVRISNPGNTPLTSAAITYQLDNEAPVVINWTGSLTNNQFQDVALPSIEVTGTGAHTFSASVSNPNGEVTDEFSTNDSNTISFTIPSNTDSFETATIRVIITPDRYGEETTWQLTNTIGNVVASGGPYTTTETDGTQPDEIQDINITVFNECYTFTLFDSYGDGLCCLYGDGTYRLEDANGNILINGTGSFGSSISNLFEVKEQSDQDTLANSLRIYPNPSASDFTIDIGNYSNITYEIHNITGQRVQIGTFNEGINTLSMRNEAAGLYFIKVVDLESNQSVTKKIIRF